MFRQCNERQGAYDDTLFCKLLGLSIGPWGSSRAQGEVDLLGFLQAALSAVADSRCQVHLSFGYQAFMCGAQRGFQFERVEVLDEVGQRVRRIVEASGST